MKSVEKDEVKEYLSQFIPVNFNLETGQYFEFLHDQSKFISFSRYKLPNLNIPCGKVIMEYRNGDWYLFGSILSLLRDIPQCDIEDMRLISKVTHSKMISIDITDGWYILKDEFNRNIALGEVIDFNFKPLVDRGNFLRYES